MSLFVELGQKLLAGGELNGLTRETAVKETTDNDQDSLDLLLKMDASTSITKVERETSDEDLDLLTSLLVN